VSCPRFVREPSSNATGGVRPRHLAKKSLTLSTARGRPIASFGTSSTSAAEELEPRELAPRQLSAATDPQPAGSLAERLRCWREFGQPLDEPWCSGSLPLTTRMVGVWIRGLSDAVKPSFKKRERLGL